MNDKSSILTYVSGTWSTLWGLATSQQISVLVGILGVIGGLTMNYYFKKREDKRQQADEMRKQADERRKSELHEITLKAMANNQEE